MVKVSLILPVHNAAPFIRNTLAALQQQAFTDFECLVVNDGSTDGTAEILTAWHDPRLRIIHQENQGVVAARNRAMDQARGIYWALLDADDICRPGRLERQVRFLDTHPDVILVGMAIRHLGGRSDGVKKTYPLCSRDVRLQAMLTMPFANPTLMMRRTPVRFRDLPQTRFAEDYDFVVQMLAQGKGANLRQVGLLYRVHGQSMSHDPGHRREKLAGARYAAGRMMASLGCRLPPVPRRFPGENGYLEKELRFWHQWITLNGTLDDLARFKLLLARYLLFECLLRSSVIHLFRTACCDLDWLPLALRLRSLADVVVRALSWYGQKRLPRLQGRHLDNRVVTHL